MADIVNLVSSYAMANAGHSGHAETVPTTTVSPLPNVPQTSTTSPTPAALRRIGPPTKHQQALMIWLCVFPTMTLINLAFGDLLGTLSPVIRTFILATVAVPIVIYGLMPQLHKIRARLMTRGRVA
jgi:hypothetical protein